MDPKRRTPGTSVTILLNDSAAIHQLVKEIQAATKTSKASGAGRVVTIRSAKDPDRRAYLEICLSHEILRKRGYE